MKRLILAVVAAWALGGAALAQDAGGQPFGDNLKAAVDGVVATMGPCERNPGACDAIERSAQAEAQAQAQMDRTQTLQVLTSLSLSPVPAPEPWPLAPPNWRK